MRRLFIKEMLEIRLYLILGICIIGSLMLLGDPLTFLHNRVFFGTGMMSVAAFTCLMGLSMYSREYEKGSMGFMLSRPIRWWWIYLTKLLTGILSCAMLTAFSAVFYSVVMPPEYHPFISIGSLFNSASVLWVTLSVGFALGFVVSCASSRFAVAIAVFSGLLLLMVTLLMEVFENICFAYWQCLPAILVFASIISVRLPIATNAVKRMRVWLFVVVVGFGIYISTNILVANHPQEANPSHSMTSPNGEWTAYLEGENTIPPNNATTLWMSGKDGQKYEIEHHITAMAIMWLSEKDSFLVSVQPRTPTIILGFWL